MAAEFVVPYAGKGSRFGTEELEALRELLLSPAHLGEGDQVPAFEAELAAFLGVRNAIAVSSCSMALELVTRVLDLGPGDEVIASPLTYEATVWSLLDRRCRVRFGDVDPETLCQRPDSVAELVTGDTKAVFVTHYGGVMADMAELREICDRHRIALVEDCAHALGAGYRGHAPGTIGDFGCFSFQSLKNISTLGQGGLITVADDGFATRLRTLRSGRPDAVFAARSAVPFGHGPVIGVETHEKNAYTHDCVSIRSGGLHAILGEPAAAVGRVQLRRLPALLAERRRIAARLDTALRAIPGVRVPNIPADREHAQHLYTFFVTPESRLSRDDLVTALAAAGIEIVLRYFPLHLLPEWRCQAVPARPCPTAERIWFHELVNLPIYPGMTAEQVDYMIKTIEAVLPG